MGGYHLQKLLEHPQVEIAGVLDSNQVHCKNISEQFSIPCFSKPEDLFLESDAVVIASPTPTHFPLGKLALEAGLHVLMEKPICDSVERAHDLVSLAAAQKLVLQTGFVERYRVWEALAPFLNEKPVLIGTERCSDSPSREPGLDVVTDLMIHDIDLVLALMKEPPVHISAEGLSLKMTEIDVAHARLQFASGTVAHLKANWTGLQRQRATHLFYEDAAVSIDLLQNIRQVTKSHPNGKVEKKQTQLELTDSLKAQLDAFVCSIRNQAKAIVSGLDGLRSLEICEAIKQKIREKQKQDILLSPREKQFLTKVWGGHVN